MFYQTQTARRLPEGSKNAVFVVGDLDLDIRTPPRRDQTRLTFEFGANPFSSSKRYFIHKRREVTDSAKNRTLRSSLSAVKTNSILFFHKEEKLL